MQVQSLCGCAGWRIPGSLQGDAAQAHLTCSHSHVLRLLGPLITCILPFWQLGLLKNIV